MEVSCMESVALDFRDDVNEADAMQNHSNTDDDNYIDGAHESISTSEDIEISADSIEIAGDNIEIVRDNIEIANKNTEIATNSISSEAITPLNAPVFEKKNSDDVIEILDDDDDNITYCTESATKPDKSKTDVASWNMQPKPLRCVQIIKPITNDVQCPPKVVYLKPSVVPTSANTVRTTPVDELTKTAQSNILNKFAIAWDAPQTLNLRSAMQISVNVNVTGDALAPPQSISSVPSAFASSTQANAHHTLSCVRLPHPITTLTAPLSSASTSGLSLSALAPTPPKQICYQILPSNVAPAQKRKSNKADAEVVNLISDDEDDDTDKSKSTTTEGPIVNVLSRPHVTASNSFEEFCRSRSVVAKTVVGNSVQSNASTVIGNAPAQNLIYLTTSPVATTNATATMKQPISAVHTPIAVTTAQPRQLLIRAVTSSGGGAVIKSAPSATPPTSAATPAPRQSGIAYRFESREQLQEYIKRVRLRAQAERREAEAALELEKREAVRAANRDYVRRHLSQQLLNRRQQQQQQQQCVVQVVNGPAKNSAVFRQFKLQQGSLRNKSLSSMPVTISKSTPALAVPVTATASEPKLTIQEKMLRKMRPRRYRLTTGAYRESDESDKDDSEHDDDGKDSAAAAGASTSSGSPRKRRRRRSEDEDFVADDVEASDDDDIDVEEDNDADDELASYLCSSAVASENKTLSHTNSSPTNQTVIMKTFFPKTGFKREITEDMSTHSKAKRRRSAVSETIDLDAVDNNTTLACTDSQAAGTNVAAQLSSGTVEDTDSVASLVPRPLMVVPQLAGLFRSPTFAANSPLAINLPAVATPTSVTISNVQQPSQSIQTPLPMQPLPAEQTLDAARASAELVMTDSVDSPGVVTSGSFHPNTSSDALHNSQSSGYATAREKEIQRDQLIPSEPTNDTLTSSQQSHSQAIDTPWLDCDQLPDLQPESELEKQPQKVNAGQGTNEQSQAGDNEERTSDVEPTGDVEPTDDFQLHLEHVKSLYVRPPDLDEQHTDEQHTDEQQTDTPAAASADSQNDDCDDDTQADDAASDDPAEHADDSVIDSDAHKEYLTEVLNDLFPSKS